MIVVVCPHCQIGLRVIGDPREVDLLVGASSEFWPDKYTCTRCGQRIRGYAEQALAEIDLPSLGLIDLNAEELFAALNGLGLPSERVCSRDVVEELLKEQPVRRVVGADVRGTSVFCLHHLELWDGTKLYFGSAPEGAVIYRVVRPPNYTEAALRG